MLVTGFSVGVLPCRSVRKTRMVLNTCKQKFSVVLSFCCTMTTAFPLTFCQNFVEKFPCPSPLLGAHQLKWAPQALQPTKIWAPPDPPRERYGGQSFNFPLPPSPSISLRQISEIFRQRAGLVRGYNPRDFGKSAGNAAGDIFTFILAPGPSVATMV